VGPDDCCLSHARRAACLPSPCRSTVNDLGSGSTKLLGVLIAATSVVGSGMQQILCGAMQRQHKMQSHQLLAATAPAQGLTLLLVGPWVDALVSGHWVGSYTLTTPALMFILLSCAISVGVNVSQFMCLGRFSAVTFQVRVRRRAAGAVSQQQQWEQLLGVRGWAADVASLLLAPHTPHAQVLGHTKTIIVLLTSWLALGESMSAKKAGGMALAVAGMVSYGVFVNGQTMTRAPSRPIISVGDGHLRGLGKGGESEAPLLPVTTRPANGGSS
jgi:solute carrier family 35 protein E3